jgi:hypothetical protein
LRAVFQDLTQSHSATNASARVVAAKALEIFVVLWQLLRQIELENDEEERIEPKQQRLLVLHSDSDGLQITKKERATGM